MADELQGTDRQCAGSIGWIFSFGIFALVIGLQLISYFLPRHPKDQYASAERSLRMKMMIRTLKTGSQLSDAGTENFLGDSTQNGLVLRTKGSNLEAAKLYVATRFESGESVNRKDLAPLISSADPHDQSFAKVYGPKALDLSQARTLHDAMPSEPFVFEAARIHALERAGLQGARVSEFSQFRINLTIAAVVFLTVGICLGSLLWLIYFICKASGLLPSLGHPAGNLPHQDADRFAVRMSQYLALFVGVSVVFAFLNFGSELNSVIGQSVLVLLLPVLARLPIAGRYIPLWVQGWRKDNLAKNVTWGILAAAANAPFLILLTLVSNGLFSRLPTVEHPMTLILEKNQQLITVMLALSAASILAPIFEETSFRGTLLPALASRLRSVPAAIIISSLLFGAMHPTGIPSWLPLAGIGTTSCLLTYQTRSLIPSMVMHAVHNCITLMLVLSLG